jgi:MarR family transcriptional regulator, organic hydroperoxide resistance regulator
MGVVKISSDHLVEYIKELDLVFSRLIYRFRVLFSRYTVDEITDTQYIVLRSLRKGTCNTSFLAQVLGVTLSAVTALINRLYKMGLVERERREVDRRQVWISITPKGLRVLKDVEDKRYLLMAVYLSKLPEPERLELLEMLRRLIKLFEREDILEDEMMS